MQYFASFEPFEIFDEFNGVTGTYIKSFLISDKINLNKWQATHEANISNLEDALGRPGIHYINPVDGKRDHTGATTKTKSLQIQELYRVASIIAVGSDLATRKHWQMSKMIDMDIAKKIQSKKIKWISPSIWPKPDSVEMLEQTDGTTIDVVHDYDWLHYAFVDEPAYDDDAGIKGMCDGTTKACQMELAKFNASIDNVAPLTEHEIKIPKKKKGKAKNSSEIMPNTSDKIKTANPESMTTEEDLQKKFNESETARKAAEEELKDLKEKEAKKATEEKEEKKNLESKKGSDGEGEDDDDKEKTAMKARIEFLEKVPIVNDIIQIHKSAKLDFKESDFRAKLEGESITQLSARLETLTSFSAKLQTYNASESVDTPYFGSVSSGESFDASTELDSEALLAEATS